MFSLKRFATSAVASAALLVSVSALASDWDVDTAHTRVGFGVKHMMISSVRGSFKAFSGTVIADDADVTKSKIHLEIDAASITTENDKRDEHLKSADFFDVAKFPKLTFDSTSIQKGAAEGQLSVTGNLTIRNVTKPVVLTVSGLSGEVKDPWGGTRRGATATAKINRKDFGLTWNKTLEAGGVVVGEDVNLEFEIELAKKAPAPKKG